VPNRSNKALIALTFNDLELVSQFFMHAFRINREWHEWARMVKGLRKRAASSAR
jgi:hypothetical protein